MAAAIPHNMTISQLSTADRGRPAWIGRMLARWRARRTEAWILAEMTDRDLADAGLNRWQLARETSRPLWQD